MGSDPRDPSWLVPAILDDCTSPHHAALVAFINGLPQSYLAAILSDPDAKANLEAGLIGNGNINHAAAVFALRDAVAASRLRLLAQPTTDSGAPPYDHPALRDLIPDTDGLVPLAAFETGLSSLDRGGTAFTVLAVARGQNSSYWLQQALVSLCDSSDVHVRPDPLQWDAVGRFPSMCYRMLAWGQTPQWDAIDSLSSPIQARWIPDHFGGDIAFTDCRWEPRGAERHLICEEVPHPSDANVRASRYLHAVYSIDSDCFIHLDGALRVFTQTECAKRVNSTIATIGKIGLRRKVFRIDRRCSKSEFGALAYSFFVWNTDVGQYLLNLSPQLSEGST